MRPGRRNNDKAIDVSMIDLVKSTRSEKLRDAWPSKEVWLAYDRLWQIPQRSSNPLTNLAVVVVK